MQQKILNKILVKYFLNITLIALMFSTLYSFLYITQSKDYIQQCLIRTIGLRNLIKDASKNLHQSIGDYQSETFETLKNIYAQVQLETSFLGEQKEKIGNNILLWPLNKIMANEIEGVLKSWSLLRPNMDLLLDNQEIILNLSKTIKELVEDLMKIKENYQNIAYELGSDITIKNKNIVEISDQIELIEKIIIEFRNILMVSQEKIVLEKSFSDIIQTFSNQAQLIQEHNADPVIVSKFTEINKYLNLVHDKTVFIQQVDTLISKILKLVVEILNFMPLMETHINNLEIAYINHPIAMLEIIFYVLLYLTFLWLLLVASIYYKKGNYQLKMADQKNKDMQIAVEQLLIDLPKIADGSMLEEADKNLDLSTKKDIITESFAYALSTIRRLIYYIAKTAKNISITALHAQKITQDLATSSGDQAREITEVTASVNAMANSIEQVSANALESASVALESVNIAGEGGQVVRSTISGMERIQTQIQETSNYMRRLSDSSQEIGEIVSLIDGIADQTNILSLNASIQAAMAGEAGRGFAVVADEVQRLAEKVSYATKEIGSLVRSIQTDTSQVISAMEQTKAQVLEGVNFAQDAGSTLEKIETVSRHLSDLIQNISSSASEQAAVSGKISHMMNDVKDIAKQTASGTMMTVNLIEKLLQYDNEVRQSIIRLKEKRQEGMQGTDTTA